jgi:hypothetical protein
MDSWTERIDHIEDVLVSMHTGQWFGWSDSKNKVYENLVIHDDSKEKPTQEFLESELQRMQGEFDAQDYARDRKSAYPPFADQFDQIFHEGIDKWKETIQAVKDAHPKP